MWWRWQHAERRRHAYDRTTTPAPGQSLPVLCGDEVTPTEGDFDPTGRPRPTCWRCDHQVRVRDGWPATEIGPPPEPETP